MMRYRRLYVPGGTYFFTVTLADRQLRLLTDYINSLRLAFAQVKLNHPFTTNAIVILPDHLHMIITLPDDDAGFSKRIGLIKSYFSKSIPRLEERTNSRLGKRERGIWQRRFWEHHIRNEKDYFHHVNYIHYNPVKHGYVTKPVDWKYSSIHRFIKEGILCRDWST